MCEFFQPPCDQAWQQRFTNDPLFSGNGRKPSRAGPFFYGNARKSTKSAALARLKCEFSQMIQRLMYDIISVFGSVNKSENKSENRPGDIMKAFGGARETGIVTQRKERRERK